MNDAVTPRAPEQHRDYGVGAEARAARLDDECREMGDRNAEKTEAAIDGSKIGNVHHRFGDKSRWQHEDPSDPWSPYIPVVDG
jgi:hypothetical protein